MKNKLIFTSLIALSVSCAFAADDYSPNQEHMVPLAPQTLQPSQTSQTQRSSTVTIDYDRLDQRIDHASEKTKKETDRVISQAEDFAHEVKKKAPVEAKKLEKKTKKKLRHFSKKVIK